MNTEQKPNPDAFYWTCLVLEHRHKSKDVAERCINQPPKKPQRKVTRAMLEECQSMRESGMTLKAIGVHFGISGARIRDWLRSASRLQFFRNNPQASNRDWWDWWNVHRRSRRRQ